VAEAALEAARRAGPPEAAARIEARLALIRQGKAPRE